MMKGVEIGLRLARSRVWSLVGLFCLFTLGLLWVGFPAALLASHETGVDICDRYEDSDLRCECMYHISDVIKQQLINASPDADNVYESRDDIKDDDSRPVAWWRVESEKEACVRLDLMTSAKGITRFLAGSVTGLVGISFVWCVVQLMHESVSGGRVVEARSNLFRTLVGLIIFGFTWVIYESFTVGLFGVQQFTAGSFVGLTGHFGY